MAELLLEIEVGEACGKGEVLMGEGGCFGEISDEEGTGDEALEEKHEVCECSVCCVQAWQGERGVLCGGKGGRDCNV